ncbi:isochorismatase [Ktedonosporobacter rubrisoli]|uniref:Isochorismatase n=1 Tax=Ktedonosporobacter rubrisoli TaxID=2509675 RepID=A0A4V0YYQ2_KTERU|nr:isochorismatase [Ktedonosporobacter rubrisoli]QBD77011.1 isochorismatase [Ktedonosporobacter rubrisoli]
MMLQNEQAYKPRPARFLELWEWQGWRVKIYGLAAQAEYPSAALVQAAKKIAERQLPLPAVAEDRYGIAFMIVHEGTEGDYVLVDWWTAGGIVQHHLYGAMKGHNGQLEYHWPAGAGFCIWELAVCWFEREAWVEAVLSKPQEPDLAAYFMKRLNADV